MNKKLQVFVSSTYTDLKEERQAAVEAILDAGHIPAGMELFKAGNESQLKTIYKWIDESDVYMLILGGRYGSIEPKTGKSYTQLEYEYALSKNIPVFAVVLSQSFLTNKINILGLSNVMEQKASDNFQTFKSLVMSKIIKEVDDCKDIKITIHSTLNEFLNEYNLIGWVRNNNENQNKILLEENHMLNKEIRSLQKQFSEKSQHQFGNYTFSELIDVLKSKSYTVKCRTTSEKSTAFEFFIYIYPLFASTNPKKAVENYLPLLTAKENYTIFRLLQSYDLIYERKKMLNNVITFSITKTGIIFYSMLEDNNLISSAKPIFYYLFDYIYE